MIIQVRGTSGSGKSTVVRRVMDAGKWEPVHVPGRKRPLYYRSVTPGRPSVAVLGHYESPCGGCDTIGSARAVWELVCDIRPKFRAVVCEGLLLSEDVKWALQTPDLYVLFLVTPLTECLGRIRARRAAAGNEKPFSEHNTANRVGVIERARVKLIEAGVPCRRCTSDQAPEIVLNWIRLHAEKVG